MKGPIGDTRPARVSEPAARLALITSAGTLASLAALHVLSPEFDPSWRVVSEYALGHFAWVLSLMFLLWAASSWSLVFAVGGQIKTWAGYVGLGFLVITGAGEALAAAFDVSWPKMHGLGGLLGVPALPVAAVLISISLIGTAEWARVRRRLLWIANLTWASLALMVIAMATLRGGIAGIRVPIGWPNRGLVVIYVCWVMSVAWHALHLRYQGAPSP